MSTDRPQPPACACLLCGSDARFGFTSRPSDVWTCMAHRPEGERHLFPPARARRDTAAPGRLPAGPQAGR